MVFGKRLAAGVICWIQLAATFPLSLNSTVSLTPCFKPGIDLSQALSQPMLGVKAVIIHEPFRCIGRVVIQKLKKAPEGFRYVFDFMSPAEEQNILAELRQLNFQSVVMRGRVAKRTVAHFGFDYIYNTQQARPSKAIPPFLQHIISKAALIAGLPDDAFNQVLINRYPAGAGIHGHKDAPAFDETIVGISLGAPAVMRLHHRTPTVVQSFKLTLEPRSLYILSGTVRSEWEHSVDPVKNLRYSITFRRVKPVPLLLKNKTTRSA